MHKCTCLFFILPNIWLQSFMDNTLASTETKKSATQLLLIDNPFPGNQCCYDLRDLVNSPFVTFPKIETEEELLWQLQILKFRKLGFILQEWHLDDSSTPALDLQPETCPELFGENWKKHGAHRQTKKHHRPNCAGEKIHQYPSWRSRCNRPQALYMTQSRSLS